MIQSIVSLWFYARFGADLSTISYILSISGVTLSQMDVPTRQSYIVSVVKDEERTAATGITNISRNISQALSPSLAGYIIQSLSLFFAPFLIGGVFKGDLRHCPIL